MIGYHYHKTTLILIVMVTFHRHSPARVAGLILIVILILKE